MSTTHDYEYIPLEDPEIWIRLLRLSPSTEDHPELRGELITCRREEAPPYRPVSYTWGQQDPTSTIFLRNDEKSQWSCLNSGAEHRPVLEPATQSTSDTEIFSLLSSRPTGLDVRATECIHTTWRRFHIRPNLEALLQQFRTLPGPKVFWVDAICIDQTNNNEKGHQVRNMDKIYKDKHLLIWLGEPTDDSNVVLDLIESFDRFVKKGEMNDTDAAESNEILLAQSASTWKAFRRFMRRPWFARRWIVQEFILSDHKDACVGNRWFCFNSIVVICYRIQNKHCYLSEDEHEYSVCRETREHSETLVHGFQSPILDPIDNLMRLWKVFRAVIRQETSALTLEKLLDNFASFESHDPRDGIYAFISMASDINKTDWFPDYSTSQTVTDVYNQAVLHIMRSGGSIDVICHRAHDWDFALSVSHPSRWIPWFGPQKVEFRPGHSHSIHGYNTKSLTTFGQPLCASRKHDEAYYTGKCQDCGFNHLYRSCDGCEALIEGITGYRCLDCPDFHYCYGCIHDSASHLDGTHRFEIHNKTVYCASGDTRVEIPGEIRLFSHPAECEISDGHFILLPAGGFLVDSIRGLGAPGRIVYNAEGLSFSISREEWKGLPGMKEIVLDEDGRFGGKFFRALTGNRRILDDRVCHIPEEDLKRFKKSYTSRDNPQVDDQNKLVSSIIFILSNSRRFATTKESLGFVPYDAVVGDRIAILMGCSVPVVIRDLSGEEDDPFWQLIGECYVEGLMEGEYMEVVEERNLLPQKIVLI